MDFSVQNAANVPKSYKSSASALWRKKKGNNLYFDAQWQTKKTLEKTLLNVSNTVVSEIS